MKNQAGGGIFRQEAIDATYYRNYGKQAIANHTGRNIVISLIGISALILVLFFFVGKYSKKVRANGYVELGSGALDIFPLRSGFVTYLPISEGQAIKRGDVLFQYTTQEMNEDENPDSLSSRLNSIYENKKKILNKEYAGESKIGASMLRQQEVEIEQVTSSIASLDKAIEIQTEALSITEEMLSNHKRLQAEGFISSNYVKQKENEYLAQRIKLLELFNAKAEKENIKKKLLSEISTQSLQIQSSLLRLEKQQLDLNEILASDPLNPVQTVRASDSGVVTAIAIQKGGRVDTQFPAMRLVKNTSIVKIKLWIPSSAVGTIQSGQRVALKFPAFPSMQFGMQYGTVKEISLSTSKERDRLGLYSVTVTPEKSYFNAYGKTWRLKDGMEVESDIYLMHRSIAAWFFDPIGSSK